MIKMMSFLSQGVFAMLNEWVTPMVKTIENNCLDQETAANCCHWSAPSIAKEHKQRSNSELLIECSLSIVEMHENVLISVECVDLLMKLSRDLFPVGDASDLRMSFALVCVTAKGVCSNFCPWSLRFVFCHMA